MASNQQRGILEALLANPRGWGMSGMASPEEGVGPGYPTTGQYTLSGMPIPDASQMPMFGSAGAAEGAKRIFMENAPDVAMLAAGPVVGGIGKAMTAAPKASAALLGALGLSAGATEAGDEGAGANLQADLDRLMAQRQSLDMQRQQALAEGEAQASGKNGRSKGTGPIYLAKQKQIEDMTQEMGRIDAMIASTRDKMSPEYARKQAKAERDVEARKPWYERSGIPGMTQAITYGTPVAAALLARSGFNKIADEGKALLAAVKEAKAAGDLGKEAAGRVALDNFTRSAPKRYLGTAAKTALVPSGVRTAGTIGDASFGPEIRDEQGNIDPTGAKQQAQELLHRQFTTLEGAKSELLPQLAQGAEMTALGALFSRKPPMSELRAERSYLNGIQNPEATAVAKALGGGGYRSMSPDEIGVEIARRRSTLAASPTGSPPAISPPTGGSPTSPATGPSEGYRSTSRGLPTTSSQMPALAAPTAAPVSANAPVPPNSVASALLAKSSRPHHSNFQPRKGGSFVKGKPRWPAND
jgi:hypothetical protein